MFRISALTRRQHVGIGLGLILIVAVIGGRVAPTTHGEAIAQDAVASAPAPLERKVTWRETPLGTAYKVYDTCDISHDRLVYVRIPMAISELQRFMQCDGEELSQTVVTGIRQKVLVFRGHDPKDSFAVVVQNQRVMHIERNF